MEKDIKIGFDLEKIDEDKLCKLLQREMSKAEKDYIRKKKLKGEKVDVFKLNHALNQRKKIKILGKLLLAKTFHRGNILKKQAFYDASNNLLKEAEDIINEVK